MRMLPRILGALLFSIPAGAQAKGETEARAGHTMLCGTSV